MASLRGGWVCRLTKGTGVLLILPVFLLHHLPAIAVCLQPDATACAEFFKRDLVFVGTVQTEQSVLDEEGFDEGWTYRLRVQKVFRGRVQSSIEVFTENSSGRFPLEVGQQYLLFADRIDGRWTIDNCGNSGLLSDSQELVDEIESIGKAPDGAIRGRIVKRSSWTGLGGVEVSIRGSKASYNAISNPGGWFDIRVVPGAYSVEIASPRIVPFDLSYDDPTHLVVPRGGCALVQFVSEDE